MWFKHDLDSKIEHLYNAYAEAYFLICYIYSRFIFIYICFANDIVQIDEEPSFCCYVILLHPTIWALQFFSLTSSAVRS